MDGRENQRHRDKPGLRNSSGAYYLMNQTGSGTTWNGGYSKADVKRFIWEHARVRFGDIPRGNLTNFSKKNLKFYADVDPDYRMPIADKPEDIIIVVMGGTGTHSLSVQTRLACRHVTVPIARKDGTAWLVPA